jgi:hypothetical protein
MVQHLVGHGCLPVVLSEPSEVPADAGKEARQ